MLSIDLVSLHFRAPRLNISGCASKSKNTFFCKSRVSLRTHQTRFLSSHSWWCSATLSVMAEEEEEEKERFELDGERAGAMVKEMRECFNRGNTKSYEWRVTQLKSISKMIDEKENDIIQALHNDLSKPQQEAFISEISMTKSSCKLALKELKHWMMPEKVKTSMATYPSSAEIVSEPLGVVLVISTWNYPFLLSLDPVIGAIAAGNAVVLKPSEIAPATSSVLAKLLEEYVDNTAIRVVEGAVAETSALLEQKWDKIFYTGSGRVGRIVMSAAAKHLTPVSLELGGKCPAVVDSDVNIEVAVRRIIAGKWACNCGQACIAPDYLITTKGFAPKLIESLRSELKVFFGEDTMESKDLSRIVNLHHFKRLSRLMDEDKVSDKIILGGHRIENQLKIAPTIFLDVPEDSLIMEEEIFGPLLPIVTVENLEDSFAVINSRPKPLAAYLFTNNEGLKKDFVKNISSGGMVINDTILQVASCSEVCLLFYCVGRLLSQTMGSTFNPQILMEKLAKLNSSQQSIETLSHWCIFHMNKAKQVVETWDRQFHCSPREQRLAFLYLANDILQNSRRKGSEFVGEFWKFLPDALRDVIDNGDEFGRNAALRLISIWEERKVFGSRGQILKEELVGRHLENNNRNGKHSGFKPLRHSTGNALDKIVSVYQVVYGGQLDEDVILGKCRNAISCIEKVDKEIGGDFNSGKPNGSRVVEELQGQHAILRDCIEQLTVVESSRANLVSHLREALQEQEFKLDQIRSQLQAAQSQSEQAGNLCRQLLNNNAQLLAEQSMKETDTSKAPHCFIMGSREQSAPVMYTRTVPFSEKSGEDPKATAAAVAAKLTASTSSAQMLSYVLSSLASEGVIGNTMKESSSDFPSEKRTKLENDHPAYIPSQNSQPPVPPYPHPDSLQHGVPITTQELTANEQPPPPSSPPPLPPLPPMQPYPLPHFMQTTPYGYGVTQQQPLPMPGYPFTAPPTNPYQSFQGSEGGFYSQPSSLPMAPISRQ